MKNTPSCVRGQSFQPETKRSPAGLQRRDVLRAGTAASVLGMAPHAIADQLTTTGKAKSVLFVFLTGGISHHDSFDMKPEAPDDIRGEFQPIATKTPGLQVCEHLPLLAQRTNTYALHRAMATGSSGHEPACHMLLTGRLDLPTGFTLNDVPNAKEWPSIPAVITYAMQNRQHRLPPAAILPEPSVNEAARFRPGQYAGQLGSKWEAWHIDIAAKCPLGNGACPDCFRFDGSKFEHAASSVFEMPTLTLPEGGKQRFGRRVDLLDFMQEQRNDLAFAANQFDQQRQQAFALLTDPHTNHAFNVERADPELVERYGKNKFGLSCLMGKNLIEAGVRYVQVNLGKNSSWDTHADNFRNLKQNLLPPFDKCISALLDDMSSSGLLDETLLIVAGEFGRTPKINKNAGRDHWGPCNTMMFAGAGVRGGNIVGATDHLGAQPTDDTQYPENFSALIYDTLGIPRDATWVDMEGRPHAIYRGRPIAGLA